MPGAYASAAALRHSPHAGASACRTSAAISIDGTLVKPATRSLSAGPSGSQDGDLTLYGVSDAVAAGTHDVVLKLYPTSSAVIRERHLSAIVLGR